MARLVDNRWGKSEVRVSQIRRSEAGDEFSDLSIQILLEGEVEEAHTEGDNRAVVPTDTMRNTVYCLAQDQLGPDLEGFASYLCDHFLGYDPVQAATVTIAEKTWSRVSPYGFMGGSSERRIARVARGNDDGTQGGIEGLVMLKTTGSSFVGFPTDQFTILADAEDRILCTSVTAIWLYSALPDDTAGTWKLARSTLVDSFFSEASASVQHQGWLMGEALLEAIPEIESVDLHLPNQHHIPFDVSRFGFEDRGNIFQPVSEPYGDIGLTVTR